MYPHTRFFQSRFFHPNLKRDEFQLLEFHLSNTSNAKIPFDFVSFQFLLIVDKEKEGGGGGKERESTVTKNAVLTG